MLSMYRSAIVFTLFFILTACKPVPTDITPASVLYQDKQLTVQLAPGNAPVETPLLLMVSAPDIKAISARLTGVSMYMGEIPLRFSQQGMQWQAEFFLGACSERHMQWQLEMVVNFADGETTTLTERFTSSW